MRTKELAVTPAVFHQGWLCWHGSKFHRVPFEKIGSYEYGAYIVREPEPCGKPESEIKNWETLK